MWLDIWGEKVVEYMDILENTLYLLFNMIIPSCILLMFNNVLVKINCLSVYLIKIELRLLFYYILFPILFWAIEAFYKVANVSTDNCIQLYAHSFMHGYSYDRSILKLGKENHNLGEGYYNPICLRQFQQK